MAYLTIATISGDPELLLDGYRQTSGVMTEVGRDHGLLFHAAAATDEGLLILNLWPSKDGSESAAGDPRRLGVVQRHGLGPGRLRHQHYDVAHVEFFAQGAPAGG